MPYNRHGSSDFDRTTPPDYRPGGGNGMPGTSESPASTYLVPGAPYSGTGVTVQKVRAGINPFLLVVKLFFVVGFGGAAIGLIWAAFVMPEPVPVRLMVGFGGLLFLLFALLILLAPSQGGAVVEEGVYLDDTPGYVVDVAPVVEVWED